MYSIILIYSLIFLRGCIYIRKREKKKGNTGQIDGCHVKNVKCHQENLSCTPKKFVCDLAI